MPAIAATNASSIGLSALFAEHVTAAAHGDDVPRVVGIDLDLLTEPADMHADRLMLALEVVAPHLFQQHLAGDDAPAIFHQDVQQAEFFGRERDRFAAHA